MSEPNIPSPSSILVSKVETPKAEVNLIKPVQTKDEILVEYAKRLETLKITGMEQIKVIFDSVIKAAKEGAYYDSMQALVDLTNSLIKGILVAQVIPA